MGLKKAILLCCLCIGSAATGIAELSIGPVPSGDIDLNALPNGVFSFDLDHDGTTTPDRWTLTVEKTGGDQRPVTLAADDFNTNNGEITWQVPDHPTLGLCESQLRFTATIYHGAQSASKSWTTNLVDCSGPITDAIPNQTTSPVHVQKRIAQVGEDYNLHLRLPKPLQAAISRSQQQSNPTMQRSAVWSLPTAPASMTVDSSTGVVTWAPQATQVGEHPVVASVVLKDGSGTVVGVPRAMRWKVKVKPYFDVRAYMGDPAVPAEYARRPDGSHTTKQLPPPNYGLLERVMNEFNFGIYIAGDYQFNELFGYPETDPSRVLTVQDLVDALKARLGLGTGNPAPPDIYSGSVYDTMRHHVTTIDTELEGRPPFANTPYWKFYTEDWRAWTGTAGPGQTIIRSLEALQQSGLPIPFLSQSENQRKEALTLFRDTLFLNDRANGGVGDLTEKGLFTEPLDSIDLSQARLVALMKRTGILAFETYLRTLAHFDCPQGQKCLDKCCQWFPEYGEWYCEITEGSGTMCGNQNGVCVAGSDPCDDLY